MWRKKELKKQVGRIEPLLREAKEGIVESATGSQVKNNKSHPLRGHSAPTRIGVADGVGDDLELKGSGGPGGGAAKSGRCCC